MAIVPRPSTSTIAVLAVIAACGGKVLTNGDNGNTTGGTGSGTSGTGTSTGTGSPTAGTGTGVPIGTTGTGTSVICGNSFCDPGWFCCNPACGTCAPPGGGCIESACVSTGATGVGGGFIGGAGAGNPVDCVKPPPGRGLVASDLISDLEAGTEITGTSPGGEWFSYRDPEVGTAFLPDPANFMASSPGLHGSKRAVHVLGKGFMPPASATNWGGGAGIALSIVGPVDLSAYAGISFWAKSDSASDIVVQFSTPDTDPRYCTCLATGNCYTTHAQIVTGVSQVERKYTVRWVDLHQPTFTMLPIPFDPSNVLNILFASNGPVPQFDFWIDEITLIKF